METMIDDFAKRAKRYVADVKDRRVFPPREAIDS